MTASLLQAIVPRWCTNRNVQIERSSNCANSRAWTNRKKNLNLFPLHLQRLKTQRERTKKSTDIQIPNSSKIPSPPPIRFCRVHFFFHSFISHQAKRHIRWLLWTAAWHRQRRQFEMNCVVRCPHVTTMGHVSYIHTRSTNIKITRLHVCAFDSSDVERTSALLYNAKKSLGQRLQADIRIYVPCSILESWC